MNNKKTIITIAILSILLGLVAFIVYSSLYKVNETEVEIKTPVINNELNDVEPAAPTDPTAPTVPVVKPDLSDEIIAEPENSEVTLDLNFSPEGLSPKELVVNSGDLVNLNVSSSDLVVHTLGFLDPSLASVQINVGPTDTRTISFTAPYEAGEYTYLCKVSGHESESGVLIVR